jgi:hypothetical protein
MSDVIGQYIWDRVFTYFSIEELFKFDSTINKEIHNIIVHRRMKNSAIINDHKSIGELFDVIYQEYQMDHVQLETNGIIKTYYPCNNMWYERPEDAPVHDYDPNIRCEGYESCYEPHIDTLEKHLDKDEYDEWLKVRVDYPGNWLRYFEL